MGSAIGLSDQDGAAVGDNLSARGVGDRKTRRAIRRREAGNPVVGAVGERTDEAGDVGDAGQMPVGIVGQRAGAAKRIHHLADEVCAVGIGAVVGDGVGKAIPVRNGLKAYHGRGGRHIREIIEDCCL